MKQCRLVSKNRVLLGKFTSMTEERIYSITLSESDVVKIIRASDVNSVCGHDNILVRMIKLCTKHFAHLLTLIFQNSLASGTCATQ